MLVPNMCGHGRDRVGVEIAMGTRVVVFWGRGVLPNVLCDRTRVRAAVVAMRALVRLLPRVSPLVFYKVSEPNGHIGTVLAFKALLQLRWWLRLGGLEARN